MDVDQVADELYGLTPEQFTPARNARANEAKAAGDKDAAAQIAGLRKPTAVAWLANSLARQRPDEIGPLLELGEALREASATLSGPELRELSRQRHRLVYALVQEAKAVAAESGRRVTDDVARRLEETLTAALTNADDGELLRQARLTDGLVPGGFAVAPARNVQPIRPPRQASPAAPAPAKGPSAEERRLAQRNQRLERDLVAAVAQAKKAAAAHDETTSAFDEAQRALTAAELGLADLRAELKRAEKARDQRTAGQRSGAGRERASRPRRGAGSTADRRSADSPGLAVSLSAVAHPYRRQLRVSCRLRMARPWVKDETKASGTRAAFRATTDNVCMVLLEAAVVLGIVGVIIYVTISMLMRGVEQPRVLLGAGGRWQTAQFAADNKTHIVVRKVSPDGATVVDEHLVATVDEHDPEYDAKFLEAMAQARQRVALFESEES